MLTEITLERYKEMAVDMSAEECERLASKYDFEADMIGVTDNTRELDRQEELRESARWWRQQAKMRTT